MKRRIALLLAVLLLLPCVAWAEALNVEGDYEQAEADVPELAAELLGEVEAPAMPEPAPAALAEEEPQANAAKAVTLKVEDKGSKTVYIGKTYQLKVSGEKIKTCKSSDTKVAKVTKTGLLTPKKAGRAKITITLKSGKKVTLSLSSKEARVELKGYFGKKLKDSAKKIGGLKAYTEKYEIYKYYGYKNKYLNISAFQKANGKISTICLTKKSKYTLFGIQVGMKKATAQAKMAKREKIDEYGDGDAYWINKKEPGVGTLISIYYKNGKVDSVAYRWYGN